MKRRLFSLLIAVLLLTACNQEPVKEQHEQFLNDKGWEIKELSQVETYVLDLPEELLNNFEASRIIFFNDYLGQEVTEYIYELKEKDAEGERLKAIVLEADGEIIGGYGVLPSWTPGLFNLNEKERLMKENMIK